MRDETTDPDAPSPPMGNAAQGRRRIRSIAIAAVALIAVGIALGLASGRRLTPSPSAHAATFSSASEHSSGMLRLTGRTQAVQAQSILAPRIAGEQLGTLTITFLVPAGSRVKKGDPLAEFDRTAQMRDFLDQQAKLSDQDDKVLEAQAKEISDRATDETEMKQAEDALSKAQLEMEKSEILSRIDAEKAKENLEEAQATLALLRDTFPLKRKSAAASIRILEIQRDATRRAMEHAQANAALMQIHAPIDGIAVFNTIWKQGSMGEVQDGDQVRPGVAFMEVVDPAAMEVQARVNQEDVLALSIGEAARIHLDAYPDLVLPGRLESIDPMGQPGDFSSKLRAFTATFSIQGADPKLMPDLSAAVEVSPAAQGAAAGGTQ